ncbi:MAG: tRNA pseudouridine(55) synthase TruB [Bacillales bacterium]|jgi:tRNA pseudouridine55 synthase|nr:tRNA pseudouridine(55) synthase TruB [Bacillales bacterium]
MNGILPINKPAGMTSHDVVFKLRKILKTKKIGHTGTLDPDVTGVLPICIGNATKIVQFLTEDKKEYVCEVTIGTSTTTEDFSGEVVEFDNSHKIISREQVLDVLNKLTGEITQIPPMYSAVKVNGKKLYEYARAGKVVERPERKITIYEFELLDNFDKYEGEFIKINFRVLCSKGTYVRTIAVSIGEMLGYPSHMSRLVRTKSGTIQLKDCLTIEEVQEYFEKDQILNKLLPLETGLKSLSKLVVDSDTINKVLNGALLPVPNNFNITDKLAIFDQFGKCYAVYEQHQTKHEFIKPTRVFNQ